MNNLIKISYLLATVLTLTCCDKQVENSLAFALDNSGDNNQELKKVLQFYKSKLSDSLKYKAAVFLIENMPYHYYREPIGKYDFAFDSIEKHPIDNLNDYREDIFKNVLDSMYYNSEQEQIKLVYDLKTVDADYLIENIELAFKAWYRIPKEKRASFNDFCNFILPYRCSNEPLEHHSRQKLFNKYAWVYKYIDKGVDLETIVDSVKSSFNFNTFRNMGACYPVALSISQVEKSKLGLCDDGVNYYVNVFRAIGIIAAKDGVEHWGNNPSTSGHSWIYTKLGNETYPTDVHRKSNIKGVYRKESIPKAFRTIFNNKKSMIDKALKLDVTKEYVLTSNVTIDKIFNVNAKEPTLNVFDKRTGWFPVALGKNINGKFEYKDIGYNVLYLPMDKELKEPINYPFFINTSKNIHFFKPTNQTLDSVALTRKIGLSTRRYRGKRQWIESLNGGVFEVANNSDFKNSKVLHRVSNFKSTHIHKIKIETEEKYKYVRFSSNKPKSFLAKLAFYDSNMKPLKGLIIEENILKETEDYEYGAFDDNTLTYSGGDYFKLGLGFKKPQNIRFIEFQARNDDNHINIGEDYELFYWDKVWQSLGKQKAKDTVLYYNIPGNSLLWLRNLTKGKEEHVFTIDENKKQKWLGFEN